MWRWSHVVWSHTIKEHLCVWVPHLLSWEKISKASWRQLSCLVLLWYVFTKIEGSGSEAERCLQGCWLQDGYAWCIYVIHQELVCMRAQFIHNLLNSMIGAYEVQAGCIFAMSEQARAPCCTCCIRAAFTCSSHDLYVSLRMFFSWMLHSISGSACFMAWCPWLADWSGAICVCPRYIGHLLSEETLVMPARMLKTNFAICFLL